MRATGYVGLAWQPVRHAKVRGTAQSSLVHACAKRV